MSSNKRRIIFVYRELYHFVKKDGQMLEGLGKVRRLESPLGKSPLSFLSVGLKQFFFLIWHIWRSDSVFCWFADYHSFLPAIFCRVSGKPLYLVLGGYDVTYLESINYGSFNKKFRGYCAAYAMRTARLNLPVADSLGVEARRRAGDIRLRTLPTGYDPEIYLPSKQKENIILTISITRTEQRYLLKGLDRFIELAEKLPEYTFVIVGMDEVFGPQGDERPSNLQIIPPCAHEDLLEWYGRARFYAQFSRSEGLPNAICEAMLRNCIPLGTRVGGIPDGIGEAGYVFDIWDAAEVAGTVKESSKAEREQLARDAREQIIRNFHSGFREKALEELLS